MVAAYELSPQIADTFRITGTEAMGPGLRRDDEKSALQQRLDYLVEVLECRRAFDHLAVDEEGRGRIDLQHLVCVFLIGRDLVEQRLVLQAILDRLLA